MAKRKSKRTQWTLIILLLLLLALAFAYQNKKYIRRAYRYVVYHYYKKGTHPGSFPSGYDVHGIDISHHRFVFDWKNLWSIDLYGDTIRYKFVFMKATEGILIKDATYEDNWEDAKDHHFIRGAYHYFLPDRSVQLQAENFWGYVQLKAGDLPPVVDVEETRGKSRAEIITALKKFVSLLESRYHVKPIIYSNINFIEDYLADDFKDYPFWVAHYYHDELTVADDLNWVFWQHSDKADLRGINGTVDVNVFNGDAQQLKKLLIK